ncbi:MAG TPA: hypothetical protein VK586_19710 [Streptosporangiaceae bacterium]|nr:hypothetical protein [Streptosporangiaceae bacterium]
MARRPPLAAITLLASLTGQAGRMIPGHALLAPATAPPLDGRAGTRSGGAPGEGVLDLSAGQHTARDAAQPQRPPRRRRAAVTPPLSSPPAGNVP